MLSVILLSMLTILLMILLWVWAGTFVKRTKVKVWASIFVETTTVSSWTWIWPLKLSELEQEVVIWFGKTLLVPVNLSHNSGAINVKINRTALGEKPSFKMLWITSSSKLDWGSYIVSVTKTALANVGVLIRSMNFLSLEVALCLSSSALAWNTVVMSGLALLRRTWICYTGLLVLHLLPLWTLASSLEYSQLKFCTYLLIW